MLSLPREPTDPLRLADWLELVALSSPGRNSSYGDLERALNRAALHELDSDELIEHKLSQVDDELQRRVGSAGSAYPFNVDHSVVSAQRRRRRFVPYLFCLCLSYFGDRRRPGDPTFPRRLFEDLCTVAAANYVGGAAIKFGWPRRGVSRAFRDAIDELCTTYIREGECFREQPTLYSKDNRVDVVAWRDSPDRLPGKLLLFGACASGRDWNDKLTELNPDSFCKKWMSESPVSPMVKAFFVPHRIDHLRWKHANWDAGVVFDRCRIAFWSLSGRNRISHLEYLKWTEVTVKATQRGVGR